MSPSDLRECAGRVVGLVLVGVLGNVEQTLGEHLGDFAVADLRQARSGRLDVSSKKLLNHFFGLAIELNRLNLSVRGVPCSLINQRRHLGHSFTIEQTVQVEQPIAATDMSATMLMERRDMCMLFPLRCGTFTKLAPFVKLYPLLLHAISQRRCLMTFG